MNRMKLSANESLHCTDYEMVLYVTEIFSDALPPAEAPKVRRMTPQRIVTSQFKL